MNTVVAIRDLLQRLDTYENVYNDEKLVRRFLGLRAALYSMLKDKQRRSHLAHFHLQSAVPTRCRNCQGTGIIAPPQWIDISLRLNRQRATPNVLIDQCPVTPADLARRVAMMQDLGDIHGKRILCIGDNDFASLLIAATCEPEKIVVVENDDRVIEFLSTEAQNGGWPISLFKLDIRSIQKSGYPQELKAQFDVFETDPPYTEVGMKFYAALGIYALKRHGVGYIVVPHMSLEDWSDELMLSVQEFLLNSGLVLTDVIPRSQTFQHEFEVISTIIRCKRLAFDLVSIDVLEELNVDLFYTIR